MEDSVFEVDDPSWGAGFSLRYKKQIGVRFDYAHYPYSPFLEDNFVDRYGITFFLDPIRVFQDQSASAP